MARVFVIVRGKATKLPCISLWQMRPSLDRSCVARMRSQCKGRRLKRFDFPAGACAGDVENFCASVKPGEARLADCLSKQQDEEAKGNTEGKPVDSSAYRHRSENASMIHDVHFSVHVLKLVHASQARHSVMIVKRSSHSSGLSLARVSTGTCL